LTNTSVGVLYTHMKKLVIKESKTIRRKVYDFLREQLLSGEIPPHERLIETKIAQEVGISRTPVREALHNLELEGLIESIPRVGYVVKPISKDEIEEICEIRTINECLAARWAMQRITPRELQALERNLSISEAEVKKGNPRSFVELDAEFHEIVARASGSERLLELCQTLRRHMLRYRIESIFNAENVLRAIGGHQRIFDCIAKRDEACIEQAVKDHLETAKQDVVRYAFGEDHEKRDALTMTGSNA
jgi:DNA-binding GntR family transcriptional regulator